MLKIQFTYFIPLRITSVADVHLLELLSFESFCDHILDVATARCKWRWRSSNPCVYVPMCYMCACMCEFICVSLRTCRCNKPSDERGTEQKKAMRVEWVSCVCACVRAYLFDGVAALEVGIQLLGVGIAR